MNIQISRDGVSWQAISGYSSSINIQGEPPTALLYGPVYQGGSYSKITIEALFDSEPESLEAINTLHDITANPYFVRFQGVSGGFYEYPCKPGNIEVKNSFDLSLIQVRIETYAGLGECKSYADYEKPKKKGPIKGYSASLYLTDDAGHEYGIDLGAGDDMQVVQAIYPDGTVDNNPISADEMKAKIKELAEQHAEQPKERPGRASMLELEDTND